MTTRVFYHKETGAPVQITASAQTKPTYQEVICYQELTEPYEYYVMEKRQFFAEYVKEFAELPLVGRKQIEKREDLPDKQPRISKGEVMQERESESDVLDHQEEIHKAPEKEGVTEEDTVQKMLAFLDADTFHDKIRILENMKEDLDEHILNNLAVSLDLSIEDGVDGYQMLLSELRIREKYESDRGDRL